MRLCTTEPVEHYFGNVRQWKREFTVMEFLHYVEKLEISFAQMTKHDIKGSSAKKGYMSGLKGFVEKITMMLDSRRTNTPVSSHNKDSYPGIER